MKKHFLLLVILVSYAVASSFANVTLKGVTYSLGTTEAKVVELEYYYEGGKKYTKVDPINIPESITYQGKSYKVTEIGANSCEGFCNLSDMVIPNSVKFIGAGAFNGCVNLSCLIIGTGVETIGEGAFAKCKKLKTVDIPNSVTTMHNEAFWDCTGLETCTIGDGLEVLNQSVFLGCSSLKSVTIGSKVNNIGLWAFKECDNLSSITIKASTPPVIYMNDSFTCYSNATVYVPYGSKAAYEEAEYWNRFKEIVVKYDKKCSTPTIIIANGKLSFDCETEDVTFKSSYDYNAGNTDAESKEIILAGTTTAHVSVYATKEGYADSDVATADVELSVGVQGDTNQDGKVTITDAVSVVNIILNNGEATAPAMESPAVEVPEVGEPE